MPFLQTFGGGSVRGFRSTSGSNTLGSQSNPAINADAILEINPSAPDGVYYFKDPNGSNTTYSTYCIMQKYGGGWMKAAQFNNNTNISNSDAVNANGTWINSEINITQAGKLNTVDIQKITGSESLWRCTGITTDKLFNDGAGTGKLRYVGTLPQWGTDIDPNTNAYTLYLDTTSNGSFDYAVAYGPDGQGRCNHTTSTWISDHNYNHPANNATYPSKPPLGHSICWTIGSSAVYTNLHWMSGQTDQSGGSIACGNVASSAFAVFLRPHRNPGYTTEGLIFDWDPGRITNIADNTSLTGTDLSSGLDSNRQFSLPDTTVAVNGGTLIYRTGNGGHIQSTSTSNGRISVAGILNGRHLDVCRSITLTCWFQGNGTSRQVLLSRWGTGFSNQWNHIIDPNGSFHSNCSGAGIGDPGTNYGTGYWSDNTWHLCHWVYNIADGTAKHYIDGSLKINTARNQVGIQVTGENGFGIMSRADDFERLIGRMGPVRIHGIALNQTQITADWNGQKARFGK